MCRKLTNFFCVKPIIFSMPWQHQTAACGDYVDNDGHGPK